VDPLRPDALPDDEEDRRAYRRYWLPKLPARVVTEMREDLGPWLGRPLQLSDEQIDVLLAGFVDAEARAGFPRSRAGDPGRLSLFLQRVLPIQLEIHSGWSELHHPGADHVVEIHWAVYTWENNRPVLAPSKIVIRAVEDNAVMKRFPHDLYDFLTAFWVHVRSIEKRNAMDRTAMAIAEPAPGRPTSTSYYRDLYAEFEVLQVEGHPEPAKELARRRGKNRSTIRTHLKRAKELRQAETGGAS
jgi:hypothetical protein